MLSAKLKEAAGNGIDSTLYVDDVFSTWLYTGNGSTQTITNGIDLAGNGGMTWIKSRSAATDHKLTDTARGATKALISDTTGAQTTDANGLTAFSSTGFSIGTDSVYNTNAATYVSWTFRKAAKFFDVVTYTGTGAVQNIAHNLGVVPGMIIVKQTNGANGWMVYHRSLTGTNYVQLNTTAASAAVSNVWNNTDPTSTVFTVGVGGSTNASGGTYVAYLFAHDTSSTGIIQCGSFTTSGTGTPNATVNLGWEPQYILAKKSSNTGNWTQFDTMRGLIASNGLGTAYGSALYPNLANAEGNNALINVNSTGFVADTGTTGETWIYMAIRRPNKPPTSGTQVYNAQRTASTTNPQTVTTGFVTDLALRQDPSSGAPTWFNRLTGPALFIQSSNTNAETNPGVNGFNCDKMNGWSDASSGVGVQRQYWGFKRAPGFFDVVCYTGTGSATTQAHNLTVVPELIIVKERSAANAWWVYSVTVGNTKYSVLNSTAVPVTSSTAWNNTTPTASVFSIGTGANVNASTQTYVAYLFATLAGISKVGSYTGNGTTQTINCGFTGGARFVLIKRTDSTGDWYVFDTARGMTTLTDPYLLLNSTAAEVATLGAVTSVTTGFAVNAAIVAAINTNAASYIFLAIA